MQLGMALSYTHGFKQAVDDLADYERAGLDIVYVAELYSFDAVSQLGFIAARTKTIKIGSGILQIFTRTPTLTAMTAAGLDYVSDGRFVLGIGASGPQVIEGFHGVPYDAPIARTRELIDICRKVWRREKLEHQGRYYTIPLPAGQGTGLGKALKLVNTPVRPRIPITLAAMGPKNVALAAELTEGWQPLFFLPSRAKEVFGPSLQAGSAKRDPALGPLDIQVPVPIAIGEDVAALADLTRPQLALYIGGMGARGRNFYNDLAVRYGYRDEAALVQDLYLAGRKDEAAAALPADLVDAMCLVGPRNHVAERIAEMREAGVTSLLIKPIENAHADRLQTVETLRDITG
jgi:F420-dependent oxidoreductase-like protein